jgi:antitoxin (DNA-binding transcriptional repressor) of toxin-antitoxin stability system
MEMKFITIRDLRSHTARLRKDLDADREVVVTVNGRPFAIMTSVEPEKVEEEILAIRRARARVALKRIRAKARVDGLDRLAAGKIEAVVAKARSGRRANE